MTSARINESQQPATPHLAQASTPGGPGAGVTAPAREGLWRLVRQALGGMRHDYTQLPLPRAILLLAIPMVLEMVMESIFAVADIFWVSKLGPDAVATVALTESMLVIIYCVRDGALDGRRRGRGPPHRRG